MMQQQEGEDVQRGLQLSEFLDESDPGVNHRIYEVYISI